MGPFKVPKNYKLKSELIGNLPEGISKSYASRIIDSLRDENKKYSKVIFSRSKGKDTYAYSPKFVEIWDNQCMEWQKQFDDAKEKSKFWLKPREFCKEIPSQKPIGEVTLYKLIYDLGLVKEFPEMIEDHSEEHSVSWLGKHYEKRIDFLHKDLVTVILNKVKESEIDWDSPFAPRTNGRAITNSKKPSLDEIDGVRDFDGQYEGKYGKFYND